MGPTVADKRSFRVTAAWPAPRTHPDGCRSSKSCRRQGDLTDMGTNEKNGHCALREAFLRGLTIPALSPARRRKCSGLRLKKMVIQVRLNDQQKQITEEVNLQERKHCNRKVSQQKQ